METGIVDFHVHAFPPAFGGGDGTGSVMEGEPFWNALMVTGDGANLQGWVTEAQMLRHMDAAGIEKAVLQGWYWQQPATAEAHNQWMAERVHRHPDRFAAFASWVPVEGPAGDVALRRIADEGFCGLGELHPAVQGFSLASAAWLRAAAFATAQRWPVLLHVTEPVGRPYIPREETDFRALQAFIESHSQLQIVLAHWGGLVFAHLLNPYIAKRWGHVSFDCAASALLYEPRILELALQVMPADRIVFGSDYPLRLYPGDPQQPEFSRFLRSMRAQVRCESDWRCIARDNALRLLGLKEEDGS